jgi:hypothetical protein
MSDWIPKATEATYEGDVLRLHQPLPLNKQQRVLVIVMPTPEDTPATDEKRSPDEILALAAQVYEGLSPDDVADIERLALDRSRFFSNSDEP